MWYVGSLCVQMRARACVLLLLYPPITTTTSSPPSASILSTASCRSWVAEQMVSIAWKRAGSSASP